MALQIAFSTPPQQFRTRFSILEVSIITIYPHVSSCAQLNMSQQLNQIYHIY